MKSKDQSAFDEWYGQFIEKYLVASEWELREAWLHACAYRDTQPVQPVEPVAWLCEWEEGWHQYHDAADPLPDEWDDVPKKITPLYAYPAAAINERVTKYNLPPLPKPAEPSNGGQCCGNFTSGGEYLGQSETICCGQFEEVLPDYYTAAQMWAYARAAIAEAEKAKGGWGD